MDEISDRLNQLVIDLPAKLERLEQMARKPSQEVMQLAFFPLIPRQAKPIIRKTQEQHVGCGT